MVVTNLSQTVNPAQQVTWRIGSLNFNKIFKHLQDPGRLFDAVVYHNLTQKARED